MKIRQVSRPFETRRPAELNWSLAWISEYERLQSNTRVPQSLPSNMPLQSMPGSSFPDSLPVVSFSINDPVRQAPWSPYNVTNRAESTMPNAGIYFYGLVDSPHDREGYQRGQWHQGQLNSSYQYSNIRVGITLDETEGVGDPPGSNPVGIPPEANTDLERPLQDSFDHGLSVDTNRRGGRRGGLDSVAREHAAQVRAIGACLSCVLLREKAFAIEIAFVVPANCPSSVARTFPKRCVHVVK